MPVKFERINLKLLQGFRERTLARATWQGPLLTFAEKVISPIARGQVMVDKAVKTEALRLNGELNRRLFQLPETKPEAVLAAQPGPVESSTPSLGFASGVFSVDSAKISGGEQGELKGADINAPQIGGLSINGGRTSNEDGLLLARVEGSRLILAVADGMGGHGDGEKASEAVLEVIRNHFEADAAKFTIGEALRSASVAVTERKLAGQMAQDAGTTFVSALIDTVNNQASIANIGDTRAYLFRDGQIQLLTRDDNFMSSYLATEGKLKDFLQRYGVAKFEDLLPPFDAALSAELYAHGEGYYASPNAMFKSRIDRALDGKRPTDLVPTGLDLKPGDIIILASDGLHDFTSYQALVKAVAENKDRTPLEIAAALRDAVTAPGDNITVAVYQHTPAQEPIIPEDAATPRVVEAPKSPVPTPLPTAPEAFEPTKTMTEAERAKLLEDLEEVTAVLNIDSKEAKDAFADAVDQSAVLREAVEKAAKLLVEKNRALAAKDTEIERLQSSAKEWEATADRFQSANIALQKELLTAPAVAPELEAIDSAVTLVLEEAQGLASMVGAHDARQSEVQTSAAGVIEQIALIKGIIEEEKTIYMRNHEEATRPVGRFIQYIKEQAARLEREVNPDKRSAIISLIAGAQKRVAILRAPYEEQMRVALNLDSQEKELRELDEERKSLKAELATLEESSVRYAAKRVELEQQLAELNRQVAAYQEAKLAEADLVHNRIMDIVLDRTEPITMIPTGLPTAPAARTWNDPEVASIMASRLPLSEKAGQLGVLAGRGNQEAAAALLSPEFEV